MGPSIIGFDLGWDYIQEGITKLKRIIEGLPGTEMSAKEFMNLHTTVYYMCSQPPPFNHSQRLYDEYKGVLDEYNTSTVLNSIKDKHDECMLKELVERWLEYKVFVRQLSCFFNYLDRYFVAQHSLPSVNEVGYSSFRDLVYTKVRDDARKSAIALINKERDGDQIDRLLLKNVIDIFVDIGMTEMKYYQEDFEEHLLDDTTEYYKSKATVWIEYETCPDYMLKVDCCLRREIDRVSHCLVSSTKQKLVEKVQHELLMNCGNQLLGKEHSGFRVLIRNDMVDDLSRMCRLYHTIPKGLELVANVFKQHITDEGTNLVQLAEEDASKQKTSSGSGSLDQVLVRKFIELHDKYMAYINNCFMNHTLFHKALKGAFEVFCNKTVAGSSGAELVSSFSDNILKQSVSKKMGDADIDIEGTLEKIVMLVAYINDKDHFAEFYRKKLARRLLFNKSANIEHEKSMLSKLKLQNGAQFTSKMEGMLKDLTLYKDDQMKFRQYLGENSHVNPGIDLAVAALTTGLWPDYKPSNLNLPSEMANCVEVFKGFYKTKTNNRKLTWIYSLGNCIINGKFELKNIELSVSTYQAAALLLFNTADKLSYSEIMTQLNLTDEDIVRILHSLSCSKYKILIKEPSTKTISPTDSFEFNSEFTHEKQRITVPLPSVDERKKVVEDVETNRRYAIDAAIVRIMKQKKVCGFQKLVLSCVEELMRSFKTDTKVSGIGKGTNVQGIASS